MAKTTTVAAVQTFSIGQRVRLDVPSDSPLYTTAWWPKPGVIVTGNIQKLFKNGNAAVAVDQLPNRSDDMRQTMNVPQAWLRHQDR